MTLLEAFGESKILETFYLFFNFLHFYLTTSRRDTCFEIQITFNHTSKNVFLPYADKKTEENFF